MHWAGIAMGTLGNLVRPHSIGAAPHRMESLCGDLAYFSLGRIPAMATSSLLPTGSQRMHTALRNRYAPIPKVATVRCGFLPVRVATRLNRPVL
eukprot:4160798-Amphidinium_carterae.1